MEWAALGISTGNWECYVSGLVIKGNILLWHIVFMKESTNKVHALD